MLLGIANWNVAAWFAPATSAVASGLTRQKQPGMPSLPRSNGNTPKGDVSPRIGLAYSVDNKTVVRAAFGTFYGTIFQNLGGQLAYPGFDNNITTNNLGTVYKSGWTLSSPGDAALPGDTFMTDEQLKAFFGAQG